MAGIPKFLRVYRRVQDLIDTNSMPIPSGNRLTPHKEMPPAGLERRSMMPSDIRYIQHVT